MLQVTDLDVFYGDAQALRGVSLTVGSGEVVSIVGSNGAGKSTLVNSIIGILRPRRGRMCSTTKTSPIFQGTGCVGPGLPSSPRADGCSPQ